MRYTVIIEAEEEGSTSAIRPSQVSLTGETQEEASEHIPGGYSRLSGERRGEQLTLSGRYGDPPR